MALTRRIARPMLASIFVVGGIDALRNPGSKSQKASAVTDPVRENIPASQKFDTETMVRINGGVQVIGGLLLALGRFRRLASVALIGSIVPTTYAGHRFWEETDEATRAQQRTDFVKNLGLLGGLILAAVDTEGAPSLGWRARRRLQAHHEAGNGKNGEAHSLELGAKSKAAVANLSAVAAASALDGRRAARRARRAGGRAGRRIKDAGVDATKGLGDARDGLRGAQATLADTVRDSGGNAERALQHTGAVLASAGRQLEPLVEKAAQVGAERAGEALVRLSERLPAS